MVVKKLAVAAMVIHVLNALIKMHEIVEGCFINLVKDFVKMISLQTDIKDIDTMSYGNHIIFFSR